MAGLRQPGGNSPAGVSGRQMESGRLAAGSSRAGAHRANTIARPWRLDPFSLPARFRTADAAADEGLGVVDLHRERVILRRALSAMRMAVNLPVAAYRGVAIRLDATTETPPFVAVTLEHADAALSLPLFASTDTDDIVAEWQIWGRVLGLPLLIGDADGAARSRAGDRRACCAGRLAELTSHPSFIAASARSSRGNRFCFLTTHLGNTRGLAPETK